MTYNIAILVKNKTDRLNCIRFIDSKDFKNVKVKYLKYKILLDDKNCPLKNTKFQDLSDLLRHPTTKTCSLENFEKRLYEKNN
jgi:hypothetical protein